ncbi:hypothetical protein PENTCL1PPCAC_15974, partial [Pristionchus entomophagus]
SKCHRKPTAVGTKGTRPEAESSSQMLLTNALAFSSLLALAVASCTLPPAPASVPHPTTTFTQSTLPDGRIEYACPTSYYTYGNFGANGPLLTEMGEKITCDPATGKLLREDSQETMLTTMICAQSSSDEPCAFAVDGAFYMPDPLGQGIKCPSGQTTQINPDNSPNPPFIVESMRCDAGEMYALLPNGTDIWVGIPSISCL